MLKRGDFIKSDKFMDVCLEVQHAQEYERGVEVRAVWWNMSQSGKAYPIGVQPIRINFAKTRDQVGKIRPVCLDEWKVLRGVPLGAVPGRLRTANWLPIV